MLAAHIPNLKSVSERVKAASASCPKFKDSIKGTFQKLNDEVPLRAFPSPSFWLCTNFSGGGLIGVKWGHWPVQPSDIRVQRGQA